LSIPTAIIAASWLTKLAFNPRRAAKYSASDVTATIQVVATAVPQCTDPDDVSCTVQAFMEPDLPIDLIEMLKKIILEPLLFSDNKNLFMLTAIRSHKAKVDGYISKLENCDRLEIAWKSSASLPNTPCVRKR
jgi:hypothetical protein